MNTIDVAGHAKIRENCFRLLSVCFYEPQKSLLLEEHVFENLTKELSLVCPDAAVFSRDMEKNILKYSDEELSVEYAKLFVGPFELLAPPYGSVYLDQGRRVMGDSTMQVIEAYQKEGLSKNDDFRDLPDHIVVEMEFMSYLLYKERESLELSGSDAAKSYAEKQVSFMNNFMRPWVPQFCDKIKDGTENEFYRSLAECLAVFVANDKTP